MRLLLINDNHGKLAIIDELVSHVQADAVIHAGDFGFYDDGSYGRLSNRELQLQIVPSDLSCSDKDLSPDERTVAAREILLLSEFPAYVEGRKNFSVPVYAVWGNHEDKDVVERLFRGLAACQAEEEEADPFAQELPWQDRVSSPKTSFHNGCSSLPPARSPAASQSVNPPVNEGFSGRNYQGIGFSGSGDILAPGSRRSRLRPLRVPSGDEHCRAWAPPWRGSAAGRKRCGCRPVK